MRRSIFFAPSCDAAAALLGGYERIDCSLDSAILGLSVNPYTHPTVESDFYQARYITTIPIGDVPALVWLFHIDTNNDVTLWYVEEFEGY